MVADATHQGVNFGLTYSDTRSDEDPIPVPIDLTMRSTTKTTLTYQYKIHLDERSVVDVMAGARYWSIDSKLKFGCGLGILAGQSITHKESWVDPIVGVKGVTFLGEPSRIYVSGSAGLGGFGIGSDLFYDLNINLDYQWNETIGTAIGHRYFDVDYDESDFLFDVKQ